MYFYIACFFSRRMLRWVDNTVCFYGNMSVIAAQQQTLTTQFVLYFYYNAWTSYETLCFVLLLTERGMFYPAQCGENICTTFLCEIEAMPPLSPVTELKITFSSMDSANHFQQTHVVECPSGHVTHSFLSCDPRSHCAAKNYVTRCAINATYVDNRVQKDMGLAVGMFQCKTKGETIPFTLVCDFRPDCQDGSDESTCHHLQQRTFRYGTVYIGTLYIK
jgi:hypothetical protein